MGKKKLRNPVKLERRDNQWVDALGKKRSKLVRKLVSRVRSFTSSEVPLPFDIALESADIVCKTEEPSWFHDPKQESMRLLLRLRGLDEDGFGRHLTQEAKVVQWILWQPLVGDPYTSKSAPDRVWRESTFPTPADFLLSYIKTEKAGVLGELVADRWDTSMMLGGANKVRKMIDDHIRDDNEYLKSCISTWLKPLKWHQEWDWEVISEWAMFGDSAPKIDIFWESDEYEASEVFKLTTIWSQESPNHANNIRDILAEISGNEQLREDLDRELVESESTTANGTPAKNGSFTVDVSTSPSVAVDETPTPVRLSWQGKVSPISMSKATRYTNSFATPKPKNLNKDQVFRPDQPVAGTNRVAFENFFKSSGRKKRPVRDYGIGRKSKSKRIKTSHVKKQAKNVKKKKAAKVNPAGGKRTKAKKKPTSKKQRATSKRATSKRASSKPKRSKRRPRKARSKKRRAPTKKRSRRRPTVKRKSRKRSGKKKKKGRR